MHTHTHTHTVEESEVEGPLGEEEGSDDEQQLPTGKIGTKKLRKIQASNVLSAVWYQNTVPNWQNSMCKIFDMLEIPSHSSIFNVGTHVWLTAPT